MLPDVEGGDFRSGAWLLGAELVAREEEQLEPALGVSLPKRDQARNLADVSEARHVHDEHHLPDEAVE